MFAITSDHVTPVTQAITFAVVGGFITILTLVLTNRAKQHADRLVVTAKADSDKAAREEHEAAEAARREEKQSDRQAAIDKEARDYARQDLVAERVERATTATLAKLKRVEDVVDVTHALVNSDKTAALKREVRAMRSTLLLMREVADLKNSAGQFPSVETSAAMTELEVQIAETQSAIDDRLAEQVSAEQRIELDGAVATSGVAAADKQVAAAVVQQAAADQQQAVADQITAAVAAQQVASDQQQDIADQITVALDPTVSAPTPLPPPPPP